MRTHACTCMHACTHAFVRTGGLITHIPLESFPYRFTSPPPSASAGPGCGAPITAPATTEASVPLGVTMNEAPSTISGTRSGTVTAGRSAARALWDERLTEKRLEFEIRVARKGNAEDGERNSRHRCCLSDPEKRVTSTSLS